MGTVTTRHLRLSLEGSILNFNPSDWVNCVTDDSGKTLTPDEVKRYFVTSLGEGKKYLPFGQPCEGWSFQTGCPGHPQEEQVQKTCRVLGCENRDYGEGFCHQHEGDPLKWKNEMKPDR